MEYDMPIFRVPITFESELYVEADDVDEAVDRADAIVFADENNAYQAQADASLTEKLRLDELPQVLALEHVHAKEVQ